jgi:hypothetical protein
MRFITTIIALFVCQILRGQQTKISAVSLLRNGANGTVLTTNNSGNVEWRSFNTMKSDIGLGSFNGSYASLTGTPNLALQNITANGATTNYVMSLGNYSATSGSVLLKANYDAYNSQTIITERSSGAIGFSAYMYQDNSATWLSGYNYGAASRSALLVSSEGLKLLTAPYQNIAATVALTTQPLNVFSVELTGRVNCTSILSKHIINSGLELRAYENANIGYSGLSVGTATNAGYFYSYRPNGLRSMYIGFSSNSGSSDIVTENGSWLKIAGGKLEVLNNLEAYKGIFSDDVYTNGQFKGGFGALSTDGVANWNDISNRKSGNGTTLLLGTAVNGNGQNAYYHTLNFEYSAKNGTGNYTQMAIPYNGSDLWLHSFYDGTGYTAWKTFVQSTKIQDVGNNDVVHTGNINSYNNNASNLTIGTLPDGRLSPNVFLKNQNNTLSQPLTTSDAFYFQNPNFLGPAVSIFQDPNGNMMLTAGGGGTSLILKTNGDVQMPLAIRSDTIIAYANRVYNVNSATKKLCVASRTGSISSVDNITFILPEAPTFDAIPIRFYTNALLSCNIKFQISSTAAAMGATIWQPNNVTEMVYSSTGATGEALTSSTKWAMTAEYDALGKKWTIRQCGN